MSCGLCRAAFTEPLTAVRRRKPHGVCAIVWRRLFCCLEVAEQ